MDLALRAAIALGVVAGAILVAVAVRRPRRSAWAPRVSSVEPRDLPAGIGSPLTFVYFTSRFCGDCAETPRVLREAAPEIRAVPVNVSDRPDLARRYGLAVTPTILLVDDVGRIRYASAGLPEPGALWMHVREAWDSTEAVREMERTRRSGTTTEA